MAVKLVSSGGGSVTVADPASTASNFTLNPPLRSGNLAVDGPAFSAYRSTNQSISAATYTKVQFDTKEFDTNSNYDNTTNFRFTPAVAGYYQVSLGVDFSSSTNINSAQVGIYKNGTSWKRNNQILTVNGTNSSGITALIYMNGTTDYLEGYAWGNTAPTVTGTQSGTFFQAVLVRAA
jgi:hypothetical protein